MGRWPTGARERLERAALELFVEQGFSETTVPQITARAGLTTRTFFRHFADKREVLFVGEEDVPALVERLMAEAPDALSPMAVIAYGLEPFAKAVFEGRLEHLRLRSAVIYAHQGLRERELRKMDTLSAAIKKGFLTRGADELTSTLSAHIAVTIFGVSLTRWLEQEGERGLAELIAETLRAFRSLAVDASAPPRSGPLAHPSNEHPRL